MDSSMLVTSCIPVLLSAILQDALGPSIHTCFVNMKNDSPSIVHIILVSLIDNRAECRFFLNFPSPVTCTFMFSSFSVTVHRTKSSSAASISFSAFSDFSDPPFLTILLTVSSSVTMSPTVKTFFHQRPSFYFLKSLILLRSFFIFVFTFVLQTFLIDRLLPILATLNALTLKLLNAGKQCIFFCFLFFIFILYFFIPVIYFLQITLIDNTSG